VRVRRSRFEISGDILEKCVEGLQITKIVGKCNLNFSTVRPYLKHLHKSKLLVRDEYEYKTTEKGREWLKYFYQIKDVFDNNSAF
jgi:predicted transcriptional regulator